MVNQHLGYLLVGILLLILTGVCWSGVWRGWVQAPFYVVRSMPITILPGLGILCTGFGISGWLPGTRGAFAALGFLAGMAGFILLLTEPDWYGPRWYRRVNRAFAKGPQASLSFMAEDPRRPGESSVDATHRHQTSERPQPPTVRVRLVSRPEERTLGGARGDRGLLVLYPQAPLWAAGVSADGVFVNEIIAAEVLRGAGKLAPGVGLDGSVRRSGPRSYLVPRVRLDTDEGTWLFETRKAKKVARAIEHRYLDPSRDIYGLPLNRHTPPEFTKGATVPGNGWENHPETSQPKPPRSSGRPKAWRPQG